MCLSEVMLALHEPAAACVQRLVNSRRHSGEGLGSLWYEQRLSVGFGQDQTEQAWEFFPSRADISLFSISFQPEKKFDTPLLNVGFQTKKIFFVFRSQNHGK